MFDSKPPAFGNLSLAVQPTADGRLSSFPFQKATCVSVCVCVYVNGTFSPLSPKWKLILFYSCAVFSSFFNALESRRMAQPPVGLKSEYLGPRWNWVCIYNCIFRWDTRILRAEGISWWKSVGENTKKRKKFTPPSENKYMGNCLISRKSSLGNGNLSFRMHWIWVNENIHQRSFSFNDFGERKKSELKSGLYFVWMDGY